MDKLIAARAGEYAAILEMLPPKRLGMLVSVLKKYWAILREPTYKWVDPLSGKVSNQVFASA